MHVHPFLSRQITLTRQQDAWAAAERARRVRAARCAPAPPGEDRRRPVRRRGCKDPVLA